MLLRWGVLIAIWHSQGYGVSAVQPPWAFVSCGKSRQRRTLSSVHPSQPHPNNYQDSRKHPVFPGAIPIDTNHDVETCINQTGQIAPSNALLGKPSL